MLDAADTRARGQLKIDHGTQQPEGLNHDLQKVHTSSASVFLNFLPTRLTHSSPQYLRMNQWMTSLALIESTVKSVEGINHPRRLFPNIHLATVGSAFSYVSFVLAQAAVTELRRGPLSLA